MINPPFITGSYYHIYNRGVEKRSIFTDNNEYLRFLETLEYYKKIPRKQKLSDFRRRNIQDRTNEDIENQADLVRFLCYCLMPNHFHLLVQQLQDGGISQFMRKLGDSYTRYFNTKNDRVGSLFQGVFKAKIVENDEYLLHLSKYIHRNSFPLVNPDLIGVKWEGQIYPYSSYKYYLTGQQHPFCDINTILSYFSEKNQNLDYQSFVEQDEIDATIYSLLIDPEG